MSSRAADDLSPWMNTSQAATYLQLHEKTVLRLLRRGLLVGHQPNGVNGCWRVHRADADAYVRGTSSKARRAS